MHRKYLGDSYDAVKRMWQQILSPWAPIFAVSRFIPDDLHTDFTRLTGIEVVYEAVKGRHSLLNDPDVGIRLPGRANQSEGKHISIDTIASQVYQPGVACVITFDQSNYRDEGSLKGQRILKLRELARQRVHSFYYASHASFLFSTRSTATTKLLQGRLIRAGIPKARLELAR